MKSMIVSLRPSLQSYPSILSEHSTEQYALLYRLPFYPCQLVLCLVLYPLDSSGKGSVGLPPPLNQP